MSHPAQRAVMKAWKWRWKGGQNDSQDICLYKRLTLPAGKKMPDLFEIKDLSNDFSKVPSFGLADIFNHLILSKADYDKQMLASWRSFDEYSLF